MFRSNNASSGEYRLVYVYPPDVALFERNILSLENPRTMIHVETFLLNGFSNLLEVPVEVVLVFLSS
jgi:hypothetical protein